MTTRLLLRGDHVVTGVPGEVLSPGWVLVEGSTIAALGPGDGHDEPRAVGATVLGGPRRLVAPGLINGHTHLFQTFLRNLADDLDHTNWLARVIGPNAGRLEAQDVHLAALLGIVEGLRGGITTVVDNHYVHAAPGATDAVFAAMAATGVRGWVARGTADRAEALAAAAGPDAVATTCEAPEATVAALDEATARWHGTEGRLSLGVATQAAWLCSDELGERLATYADHHDLVFHAHCAETTTSVRRSHEAHGTSDERFFARHGLVRPGTSLVHGVHLDDDEQADVARRGAAVVHCPVANAYLASGTAPVPALLAAGVPVALGTDGAASNDRQDGFEVLKLAALLPRLAGTGMLRGRDVLDLAWSGGARALGLQGRLGVLAPGAYADVMVVSTEGPHLRPLHDPLAALVFNARPDDVHTVVVHGRVVVEGGRATLVDTDELLARCDARAEALGLRSR